MAATSPIFKKLKSYRINVCKHFLYLILTNVGETEVNERVELCFCSHYGPSWPVQGRNLCEDLLHQVLPKSVKNYGIKEHKLIYVLT